MKVQGHCWMARYEAEGYTSWLDWFDAVVGREPPVCADEDLLDFGLDICLLEDGHAGWHEFIRGDEISVTFPSAN